MADLIAVEITGNALVKIKRKLFLTPEQAKDLLANDKSMIAALSKNQDYEIQDWGVVYGEKSHSNWVENLNVTIGA